MGPFSLARALHRRRQSRGAIILYHRVNDYSKDPLTVDSATFAAHLLALSRHYPPISTSELVDSLERKKSVQPTSIAVHFDDCYREVYTVGAPILASAGFPATAFISSGFIDTDKVFPHDSAKYPFTFPNLRAADIRAWVEKGFETGAHTVNHVDLGSYPPEQAGREITECGTALEALTGKPVRYFSFPFGRIDNIRSEAVASIREAGYVALFSAHGGFVESTTDPYDIPRIGASGELSPLYLLMEIEGLAPNQLLSRLRKMVGH